MHDEPGIEDAVAEELSAVANAYTAVRNGVGQDDHDDGWSEALHAASGLVDAADDLASRIRKEVRRRGL